MAHNGDYLEDETLRNLPRGVALSWGLVKEPQRGPKREMNTQQIVEAAIAIADKDGLAAVSMNRVAAALGFTAMSLYRYIPSKEDLLLLMQDAVCEVQLLSDQNEVPDWRESMREYVRQTVQVFRGHPWFGDLPISGLPITPNNLKIIDWVLQTMRGLLLNDHEKMSVVLLLSSYARACGMLQRDFDRAVQSGVSPDSFSGQNYTAALKLLVHKETYPNLQPLVMSGAFTGDGIAADETIDDFDFGLERILDGIERFLDSKQG